MEDFLFILLDIMGLIFAEILMIKTCCWLECVVRLFQEDQQTKNSKNITMKMIERY